MRWRHTRQMKLFDDRGDAGRQLAQRLAQLSGKAVVVLGLPRGGVPVAFEVAKSLQAPLDVLVVRKLGVPFQPELAFGAIGEDGVRVLTTSSSSLDFGLPTHRKLAVTPSSGGTP